MRAPQSFQNEMLQSNGSRANDKSSTSSDSTESILIFKDFDSITIVHVEVFMTFSRAELFSY